MADESVIIEVKDQVSDGPARKIREIANEAIAADKSITALKAALASINNSALTKLKSSLDTSATKTLRVATANQKLEAQATKTAAAYEQLAYRQQRTATATMQAEAALNRAVAAEIRATTETQKLATAQHQTALTAQRVATEQIKTATTTEQLSAAKDRAALAALRLKAAEEKAATALDQTARQVEKLKAQTYPLYTAQQAFNNEVRTALSLYQKGAIDLSTYNAAVDASAAKLKRAEAAQETYNNGIRQTGKNAGLARHHLLNLGFQLQDIGVSLASGQNPLVVAVQQGAQIQGIAQQAQVSMLQLARAAAGMLLPFIKIAAVLGVAYSALRIFNSETEKASKLEEFSKGLGLTEKEIKRLDASTITLTDTFKGLWATIAERTQIDEAVSFIWNAFKSLFQNLLELIALSVQSWYAIFSASAKFLVNLWDRVSISISNSIKNIANVAMSSFEGFLNPAIESVNLLIAGLNKISKTEIAPIAGVSFERFEMEQTGGNLVDAFVDDYTKSLKSAQETTSKFLADWAENNTKAAKERIKKAAGEDLGIEKRAASLAKITAELDNEIARMRLLAPEREKQQQFDRIEEQAIGKRLKLSDAEKIAIQEKIATIQAYADTQRALDSMVEEVQGPLKAYNAAIAASNQLLQMGVYSVSQHALAMERAKEIYAEATNPLYSLNKELEKQQKLLASPVASREVENEALQLQLELLKQGKEVSLDELKQKINLRNENQRILEAEKAINDSLIESNRTYLEQLQAIQNLKASGELNQGQASQALIAANPDFDFTNTDTMLDANAEKYASMYARIEEMRSKDLVSEQTASALKMQVWQQEQQQKFAVANTFFGNLSQLQSTQSKKMQRIGKAAAIAQAMVNTYLSATAAYASLAPIPIVGPALGVAAAAAAIAAGLANVNAIRSQPTGFMSGGYTGDVAKTAVAGVVHGQEYVFDAAATSRIGVQNLEALRAGELAIDNFAMPTSNGKGQTVDARQFNLALNVEAMDAAGVDGVIIDRKDMIWQLMVEAANEQGKEL